MRVFTTDPKRIASQEQLDSFQSAIELAAAQNQGMSQEEINKLPLIEQMPSIKGTSEGQIRVFRNQNKQEAYMWKSAEQKWELIGEVQGAADQPPQKKFYEGTK